MVSRCGLYVIAFNGEIYNHLALRQQVERMINEPRWRGHSDTETLLACFSAWGIEETLEKTVGMFALALWDKDDEVLTLARDRLGEKPLYWGWCNDTLLFGSELKSLKCHPEFDAGVDRSALALLLRYNSIPAPYSIYQGIQKLPAGHMLEIRKGDGVGQAMPKAYWALNDVIESGLADPFMGSDNEVVTDRK